jgi:signal peptidase I
MSNNQTKLESFFSIAGAVLIALLIRTIVFEPYSIPSGSMKPNFLIGDYLFVSKYHYGISNASFPFDPPIFKGRIFEFNQPKLGEVIVFKSAHDRSINYIKRLVGLPGDEVQVKEGILYLNGMMVKREAAGTFTDTDGTVLKRYSETLPNGTSYYVLEDTPNNPWDNTGVYKVPAGHYFFMGDNRDHSADSRFGDRPIGFVAHDKLIGRAEMVIFSNSKSIIDILEWPVSFDLKRFFNKV